MTTTESEPFSYDEVRRAGRNHSLPLEVLRYDVTPVGLHYLLIHHDIPHVDAASWRLVIDGAVQRRIEVSLEDLRARAAQTQDVTLECAGTGRARMRPRAVGQPWMDGAVGTGTWTGTPLQALLEEAGVAADAVEVIFTGADRGVVEEVTQPFARSLSIAEALRPDVLLAYELNGGPLPVQHGFPARLLVPGWYGMASVKWLTRITVSTEPFDGYYQRVSYRFRQHEDEPGEPVTRIAVRSLITPPGAPAGEGLRVLEAGRVTLGGRAWSGSAPITAVDFSDDGGGSWKAAEVLPSRGPYAWHGWRVDWDARPGDHVLCCRATDATGATQPLEPRWNLRGYAGNDVHRLAVSVI